MVWGANAKVVGSSPTGGILSQLCERVNVYNEITHSHICAKMPPAGPYPAAFAFAAQAIKQLTKMADWERQAGRAGRAGRPTKMK